MTSWNKIDKHLAEGSHEEVLRTRSTYEHGMQAELPIFYRFVVLETIFDPTIIDVNKASHFEHNIGVSNIQYAMQLPRNTIIGQRVQDGRATAEAPMFLFPFFPPGLSMTCQPGEHVWVMFESPGSKKMDLGYWFNRIVEPGYVEDANHTHAPRAHDPSFSPSTKDTYDGNTDPKHEFRNGRADTDADSGDRYTIAETSTIPGGDEKAYEKLITSSDGGKLTQMEPVPRFRKRPGDIALEGSNNTLIVLGRDRSGAVAKYADDQAQGKVVDAYPDADVDVNVSGAGSIDIVVGRGQTPVTGGKSTTNSLNKQELKKSKADLAPTEGDPDPLTDRSRVLVSQKVPVDKRFGLDSFNGQFNISDNDPGDGAIVVKSDKVRLMARSDVEIVVTGFDRGGDGTMTDKTDASGFAAFVVTADGKVILKPGTTVYLGGPDAQHPVCFGDVVDDCVTKLQQAFEKWVPVPNDGGAALKTAIAEWTVTMFDFKAKTTNVK